MKINSLRLKRAFHSVLIVLLLSVIGMTNAMAQSFTVGGLNYSLNEGGTTVTLTGPLYGTNATGTLSIPSEVTNNNHTYTVTAIGDNAFKNCTGLIGSVVIPNSVVSIGASAFSGCFALNGSLTIGNSVTSIGNYAFQNCTGFTGDLVIPNSVITIDTLAFADCSGFTGSLTLGNSVTTIGPAAFMDCGFIGSLIIPNSVTAIQSRGSGMPNYGAFSNCNGFTGNLIIPNSVEEIGAWAFSGCTGFAGSLTIGTNVTQIGGCAFFGCNGFTELNYNATYCTSTGYFDFFWGVLSDPLVEKPAFGFTQPFTLNIGNNVQYISNYAFYGCSGLTTATIPDSVTYIGISAFRNCTNLAEVTIGTGLMEFGYIPFYNSYNITTVNYNATACTTAYVNNRGPWYAPANITTLNIGENVQIIPDRIFRGFSGLTGDMTIPNSVTTIGYQAFYNCTGLTGKLTLGTSLTSISNTAFQGCTFNGLEINMPYVPESFYGGASYTGKLTLGSTVISVEDDAFGVTGLDFNELEVNMPNIPESFAWNSAFQVVAFNAGTLDRLTLGSTVQTIGNNAFQNCTFNGLVVNMPNIPDFFLSHLNATFNGPLTIGNTVNIIGQYAFNGTNSNFTGNLVIPSSVYRIRMQAFGSCTGFTSLVIEEGVNLIDLYAFVGCTGFTGDLVIPNSVTAIGQNAFADCTGLTGSLTIGNSVNTIGDNAFQNCTFDGLDINMPNVPTWMVYYSGATFTGPLTIGESVTTLGQGAFGYGGFTGNLTIGNSISEIPYAAFYGCSNFTGGLTIPNTVTTIGDYAFGDCMGFNGKLIIPNSVTSIGNNVFQNCTFNGLDINMPIIPASFASTSGASFTGLLTIGNNVGCILDDAFYNSGFTSLNLGNSVELLSYGAFAYCSSLTGTLTIPSSVTEIGMWAFGGCTGLSGSLVIPASVTSLGNSAFRDCQFTGDLVIPNSLETVGRFTFANCTEFNSLTIPNSVTTINYCAFSGCTGLSGTLTLPASLTYIDEYAFEDCTGFTAIHSLAQIPPRTYTIEANVFYNMSYDIPVTVPCGSGSMYQYAWNWMNFHDIQEDCSEMFAVSAMANPSEGGIVVFGTEGETLLTDSFEEYTVGNPIASEANFAGHNWWSTWSAAPGSAEDGIVTDYNGTHCGHLIYGNDQILLLNKESGVFDLEFDILVPQGKNAFFSVLHQYNGSVSEAMECYLHLTKLGSLTTASPGHGIIQAGDYMLADIPCVYDAWMHIRLNVDIDANIARFYFTAPDSDELLLTQWPWSWDAWSILEENADSGLAGMDFYPDASSEFYIDNFSLKQYGEDISKSNNASIQITSESASNELGSVRASHYFVPGSTCTLTAIPNEGYNFVNWKKEGTVVSTAATYSFTINENETIVANFVDANTQIITLAQGWNWCSFNHEITLGDLQEALVASLGNNASITIKSQTQNCKLTRGVWTGQLTTLDLSRMYNISVDAACEITLEGAPVNPAEHPVTIISGANWIAFPLSESMTITEAFGAFGINGDVIKSQLLNCRNTRGVWTGQLDTLEPGKGYIYNSAATSTRTFTFPASTK